MYTTMLSALKKTTFVSIFILLSILSTVPTWCADYDFNNDETSDILYQNIEDGRLLIWTMNNFARTVKFPQSLAVAWDVFGKGDFNGDGTADVLYMKGDGTTAIAEMSNAARTNLKFPGGINPVWSVQGVGDFNGDGTDDILWQRSTDGVTMIWGIKNSARNKISYPGALASFWRIVGSGDFNNDGTDDILCQHNNDGRLLIWKMNNYGRASVALPQSLANTWAVVGVGDFNADGTDDVLYRKDTGDVAIAEFRNLNRSALKFPGGIGLPWSVKDVGDYDGDGTDDIFFRRASDGVTLVWDIVNSARAKLAWPGGLAKQWAVKGMPSVADSQGSDVIYNLGQVVNLTVDHIYLRNNLSWGHPNSTSVKGYNVYMRKSHFWEMEGNNQINNLQQIYTTWSKINSNLVTSQSYTHYLAEEYNTYYEYYVVPVNILNAETAKTTTTEIVQWNDAAVDKTQYIEPVTPVSFSTIGEYYIPTSKFPVVFTGIWTVYCCGDVTGSVTIYVSENKQTWSVLGVIERDGITASGGEYWASFDLEDYKGKTVYLKLSADDDTFSSKLIRWVMDDSSDDAANRAPTAAINADSTGKVGEPFSLDASDSQDPDGDSLTYLWALQNKPSGSNCSISNTTSQISTFTPDVAGEYIVSLVVDDGLKSSLVTTAIVTINPEWKVESAFGGFIPGTFIADSNGKAHSFWIDIDYKTVTYITNKFGFWYGEEFLLPSSTGGGGFRTPIIALDKDNNVHGSNVLRPKYFNNANGNWAAEEVVMDVGIEIYNSQLLIDSTDKAHLVGNCANFGGTSQQLCHITNKTGTWETEVIGAAADSALSAVMHNDKIHMVYFVGKTLTYATNIVGSWYVVTTDFTTENYVSSTYRNASLDLDSEGGVHVVMSSRTPECTIYINNKSGDFELVDIVDSCDEKYTTPYRDGGPVGIDIDLLDNPHITYQRSGFDGSYFDYAKKVDNYWIKDRLLTYDPSIGSVYAYGKSYIYIDNNLIPHVFISYERKYYHY